MNKFAAYLEAYADTLAKMASELSQLHTDLCELRDELKDRPGVGVVDDQRQEPLPLKEAA